MTTASTLDQVVAEARKKARDFFDNLPQNADARGTLDALAKLLLDEGAAMTRANAEHFAQAVVAVFAKDGKESEGRELLKRIHAHMTGAGAQGAWR